MTASGLDGYVSGGGYPSKLHGNFTPGWIDAFLERYGLVPPRVARAPFAFADLGCGDGFGLIVNAAAYPEGQFFGIDATPSHIARGQTLIAQLGLTNIELRCQTFDQALSDPGFAADYVMAQGVLTWVTPGNRVSLFELANSLLKPGGVFAVGYNALPGWLPLLSFQKLILALADPCIESPADRFEAVYDRLRSMGLVGPDVFQVLDDGADRLPRDYFPHEYLNAGWQPAWATDAIGLAESTGLSFLGSALPLRLRSEWAASVSIQPALAAIDSIPARELATDIATGAWFRVDLFGSRLAGAARAVGSWLDRWWVGLSTPLDAEWTARTPAGTIRFDNDAARAILAHFAKGPSKLCSVPGIGSADLLNTVDALLVAGLVAPAEPPCQPPMARAVNRMVRDSESGKTCLNGVVSRHGPVALPRQSPDLLTDEMAVRLAVPL